MIYHQQSTTSNPLLAIYHQQYTLSNLLLAKHYYQQYQKSPKIAPAALVTSTHLINNLLHAYLFVTLLPITTLP